MVARHPRQRPAAIARALERVPMPAFTITREGVVDWANESMRALVGDVIGQQYTVMIAPESRYRVREAFVRKRLGDTDVTEYEAVILERDGTPVPVEISSVSLEEDGHFVGVFGFMRPEEALPPHRPLLHDLTPRQAEVLRYLARGCSTTQIADQMGVSVDTVRNHIRDLLKRLGVHSRLGAVVVGRERGLV
jgi:PAS domain S-box-containing protein